MASAAILASLCGRSPYAHGWKAAAKIGARTRCIAVCTTRAATGALPRGRVPPVGCGISPRRTGGHREGSVRRGSCTLLRLSPACPPTTIASIDGPSTPGAPWLAWPCCQASQRTSFGLGIEGPLQLPHGMGGVGSHPARTPSSTALHSVPAAGALPAGWVLLSQTLERYYAPRGLLPRPPGTSVALIPRRGRRPPASEAISQPGVIRLSPPALANTPGRADGSAVH